MIGIGESAKACKKNSFIKCSGSSNQRYVGDRVLHRTGNKKN